MKDAVLAWSVSLIWHLPAVGVGNRDNIKLG